MNPLNLALLTAPGSMGLNDENERARALLEARAGTAPARDGSVPLPKPGAALGGAAAYFGAVSPTAADLAAMPRTRPEPVNPALSLSRLTPVGDRVAFGGPGPVPELAPVPERPAPTAPAQAFGPPAPPTPSQRNGVPRGFADAADYDSWAARMIREGKGVDGPYRVRTANGLFEVDPKGEGMRRLDGLRPPVVGQGAVPSDVDDYFERERQFDRGVQARALLEQVAGQNRLAQTALENKGRVEAVTARPPQRDQVQQAILDLITADAAKRIGGKEFNLDDAIARIRGLR